MCCILKADGAGRVCILTLQALHTKLYGTCTYNWLRLINGTKPLGVPTFTQQCEKHPKWPVVKASKMWAKEQVF